MEKCPEGVFYLLHGVKILIDLLIDYNATIPSTAAGERIFSRGMDTQIEIRASLSDASFCEAVSLNQSLIKSSS